MDTALFLEQFGHLAESPDGVQKLRGLILDLAVRGKLVAQCPDDEPASELLKRIEAEKKRLVKAGEISKQKPLPPVNDDEIPYEIPEGWIWVYLGQLTILENGDRSKNYPSKDKQVSEGIPFINAGHLQNNKIALHEMNYITEERFDLLRSGKVKKYDLLFCLRGSLGKFAIVDSIEKGAIASSLIIIRAYLLQLIKYFQVYLASPLSQLNVKQFNNGTAQPNLSGSNLSLFVVPLPPLAEQQRIVARVDELMALCDQLEAERAERDHLRERAAKSMLHHLTDAASKAEARRYWGYAEQHFPELFDRVETVEDLRATILQLAVQGRLVPQNPDDEPASELLKLIEAEKKRLYKDSLIRKPEIFSKVEESLIPDEIPCGWMWTRFGNTIELISGQHLLPQEYQVNEVPESIPYITGPAEFGVLYPVASKFTFRKTAVALKNDILITVKGAGVGKLNISDFPELAISRQLMAVRPIVDATRIYFYYFLKANYDFFQRESVGMTVPGLSRTHIQNMVFLLPPLAEQERIVAKVNELMQLCDQLAAEIGERRALSARLLDSVVYHLFEGEG